MGSSGAMFFEPYSHNPKNKGLLRDIMRPEGPRRRRDEMTPAQHYTDFPPGNLEKLLEQAVTHAASRRTCTRSATRATASSSTSTREC